MTDYQHPMHRIGASPQKWQELSRHPMATKHDDAHKLKRLAQAVIIVVAVVATLSAEAFLTGAGI